MNAYILPLSNPQAELETVGGKGTSLAKMIDAGLPVPDGFHITTAAYRRFIQANHLQERIMAALKDTDAALPASLEKASQTISGLFAQSEMPADMEAAIREAYQALDGARLAVAVRSSATAEDLPEASFAGQQETYLNISGADALLEAVKKCWASLWTARAIAYRIKNKVDQKAVALAVVVQELVDAQAAGIMFTTNPVDGREDEVVINAAWGLGEAIVGGLVSPDMIRADRASGKVKSYEAADKALMTVRTTEGTQEKELKGHKRKAKVLNEVQIAELVRLAGEVEDLYKSPQDIEWCLAKKKFFIVQARPVTTTTGGAFKADWTMPDPKSSYMRSSFAEHLPNPVSTLFGTLGLRAINASTAELADSMDMDLSRAQYQYLIMNGYVYMGYKLNPKFVWDMLKVTVNNYKAMLTQGTERWQVARKDFAKVIEKWEKKDLDTLSGSEILKGVREIMYAAGKYYTVIQSGTLPSATTSEMIFSWIYKKVKQKGDPEASRLLLGLDSIALRAEKSLFDIAEWIDKRPDLRAYFSKTSSEAEAGALQADSSPKGVDTEEWSEFKERFNRHMHDFGGICYEIDFMNATAAEMPELILDAIKVFLEGKGGNPYQREREAQELREKTKAGIMQHGSWIFKRWFKKSFRWALKNSPVREDSLADMSMGHATMRRFLHELGGRLAANGAIRESDDIYWLTEAEVDRLATALDRNEKLQDLSGEVPRRKADWQAQMKIRPPVVLPETSPFAKMIPWARVNESEDELKGVAASAGLVTGTARVLFGPDDFERMQLGDILVAVTTTPAWTPLFAMAAGVVTDIGGPLSHSSIVAREYGIPAVLATGVATRMIRDGQTITVDGGAGLVNLKPAT